MPEPQRPTSDELASGRLDSQWIELEGIVRSLTERGGGLVLNVSSGAFECSVFVLKYPTLPADIVDSQIRVRGVFSGLYDPSSNRFIGFQVLTPSGADVKILERPTQGLWSVPVRPIRLFLRLTPEGAFTHRVRVRGVVTLQRLGRFLCLRDNEGALLVNTTQPTPLKAGDLVDATGYPAIGDYTAIMRDAIFQRVGGGPAPQPVAVEPEKIRAGDHNADLVRLSARLLNCTTRQGEEVLELQAGQVTFRAVLNTATNSSPLGALRAGSLLQLTGVMIVEADKNHEPKGFEILLRSPADVVVLELPSWWAAGRIAWLLIILAGIVIWISFWVVVLRRRVEERTETIRATLESTVDGILVVNSAGKIVTYNRKLAEMWRIPESVLESRDDNVVLNFVLPQLKDPEAFLTRVRQTYADHDAQTDDVIEFKDGRVFERHSEPQRIMGRNVGRVWGFRNVTERKRAEEALIEEKHLLHTLMDNLPDHIYFKDRQSRFIRGNTALANWFGLTDPTQLLGKTDFDFFSDEHARQAYGDEQEVIRTGRPIQAIEEKETWPDGRETWASTTKMPLRDAQGRIIGTFGLSRDITARKQAEEALRASEEHFRSFIENLPVGIYRSTPDGRVLMANPALLRMLGYDSWQEVASRNLEHEALEAGYSRGAFREQIEGQGEVRGLETTWKRRDGSVVFIRESARAIRADDGRVLYYDGTIEDITERRRLEEQFRQAQKMEAVGRLAAGVAHDFNNLLTVVIGYSDLLLQRLSADDGIRRRMEEIKKAGERGSWLTRQLLAFSRKQVLKPQVLDLNSLLTNVDQMLRRVIGEDIELVTHVPPGLGCVKADPGQIEQVIMNLAVNARDAMPRGGQLTLEAANAELDSSYARRHESVLPGHYVMLAMSDTGIGMDAETQAHVFEPFFTTKEPGRGTGLGLSTVYGIVKQSGGSIWVYSEPGKGTTFKVYLPRIDQAAEAITSDEPSVGELARGSETILLVEDEKAVRSLAREILECRGYHVLETDGAIKALEVGEGHKEHIHLLLTDVVMPQMSGRELAEHLAPLHPETKVLYMSGYADNAVVQHRLLGPGTALLQKPFTAQALARKLREVLDSDGDHEAGLTTCPPAAQGTS
jgi:PAS domain S-box-containing protein